jgi:hypothetical protein
LFGAVEFVGDVTVVFGSSFELQLAKASAPINPKPMKVSITRPVVQKPCAFDLLDELSEDCI